MFKVIIRFGLVITALLILFQLSKMSLFIPELSADLILGLERRTVEFQKQYAALMEGGSFMFSVGGQAILMFLTVFLIGFVVSIIGGLILQRKQDLKTA